jgi:hypothetical protein
MVTVNRFGTHLAPLAGCVAHTDGPVIELGAGLYSTSVLHAMCQGRELVTADSNAEWLDRLRHLETDWHRFVTVDDWSTCHLLDQAWAVALVDQSPGWTRPSAVERLRKRTELLVVHDVPDNPPPGHDIDEFRHRADFFEPGVNIRTSVASDLRPIPVAPSDLLANHVSLGVKLDDVSWNPSSQWTVGLAHELPALPAHFYLVGELSLTGFQPDQVGVQAVFRTDDIARYYVHPVTAEPTIPPHEALVASEAAEAVGDPEWSAVNRLEIRARAGVPGAVTLRNLDLRALPPRRGLSRGSEASPGRFRAARPRP